MLVWKGGGGDDGKGVRKERLRREGERGRKRDRCSKEAEGGIEIDG